MLRVTESARSKLYNMLMGRGSGEMSLRLTRASSERLGLVIDRESVGDQIIEHKGVKVLLVGADVVPFIDGVTIDARREDGHSILTINRA